MSHILPHEWVKIHADTDPEAVSAVVGSVSLTYAELDRRADELARRLVGDGVGPGDLVQHRATTSIDTIVALVAIPRTGAVIVPYGPHRIEEAGPLDPATCAVVPTSGSTGRPRGVVLTRRNVAAAVAASRKRLGTDASDRWLLTLPLFHVGGLSIVWRTLSSGGTIEGHALFDAEAAAGTLRRGSVTAASLVPTMLRRILDVDPGPYTGLKTVLLGGAPADASLIERALDAGMPILQTYGMTESCSQVATVEPGTARASLGTAGPPLDGFEVEIIDGEVVIDGPAVSPGYLGESPRSGPFHTGDLGRFDANGRLVIVGRKGDVIITGGENVHPATVESAIEACPSVNRVVVVGVDDTEWGQAVVAVVETDRDTAEAIAEAVRHRLAPHEVPKRWVLVDRIPLLPNGKPDRRAASEMAVGP